MVMNNNNNNYFSQTSYTERVPRVQLNVLAMGSFFREGTVDWLDKQTLGLISIFRVLTILRMRNQGKQLIDFCCKNISFTFLNYSVIYFLKS